MRKHGPWNIVSSRDVYSDPWLQVVRDEVIRPDGNLGSYATVRLKSGVCVLAVDEMGMLHLTREFHYAVGRFTIEGVSGGIEHNESPLITAQRELQEELGFMAEAWEHCGTIDPFTGSIYSTVDLYIASKLTVCDTTPEGTEQIEKVEMSLPKGFEQMQSGEITHAPTCLLLFHLAMRKRWSLDTNDIFFQLRK